MSENTYVKTAWQDHIENPDTGEIIQQGTRFTAERANNIEEGVDSAHEKIAAHQADDTKHLQPGERLSWNAKETPAGAQAKVERTSYSTTKSGKDAEGTFTNVEYRRKLDNTLAGRVVLSGGLAPKYTTRTITYYATDGITVAKTEVFALSYDADGQLISEV